MIHLFLFLLISRITMQSTISNKKHLTIYKLQKISTTLSLYEICQIDKKKTFDKLHFDEKESIIKMLNKFISGKTSVASAICT